MVNCQGLSHDELLQQYTHHVQLDSEGKYNMFYSIDEGAIKSPFGCCVCADNRLDWTSVFSKWTNARIRCSYRMDGQCWKKLSAGKPYNSMLLCMYGYYVQLQS